MLLRATGKDVREQREELFGGETESDLFVLIRAYRYAARHRFHVEACRRLGIHAQSARQVEPLWQQFLDIAQREGLDVAEKPAPREALEKCILTGFSDQVARRLDAGTLRCALVHGRKGVLARESVVTAPLLVATEIAEIEGRDLNVLLSGASAVREEWLRELFPEDFADTETVVYDLTMRRVFVERQRRFRDLVLAAERSDQPSLDAAARLLAAEVVAGRLVLNEWTDAVEQWIARVNGLRQWMPELELPAITADDRAVLIEQVCHGAVSYKEIKDKPVWPTIKSWLAPAQQAAVDEYAPERLELPGGRRAKITYAADGPPRLAARIQDLYGVNGLWVAQRRMPLLIEILAPNQRPVQVTQNLAGFWKEMYPKLKQELQRKYPKHEWR
jgi:ATP-dependent helicase HrpB